MYVMVCTRLDIAQVVGFLPRYMSNPNRIHWDVIKRVSYMCGVPHSIPCFIMVI